MTHIKQDKDGNLIMTDDLKLKIPNKLKEPDSNCVNAMLCDLTTNDLQIIINALRMERAMMNFSGYGDVKRHDEILAKLNKD